MSRDTSPLIRTELKNNINIVEMRRHKRCVAFVENSVRVPSGKKNVTRNKDKK